ncbi:NTP transferase domain-containing protein [Massilia sp. 9096]|uniref:nucleotidyltransferase family protein n=1 Tax=Massilia sp. 9096 TaxID=1500894 RepID=UPI000562B872|nr:nucleotidyltransferase family protein [Massilia sp. 9096]
MRGATVGILMAAGRGRRFDPQGLRNKLLQPLPGGDDAVVVASARKLLAVLPRVVAVVPPDDGGVGTLLASLGCTVTVCPDADSGMAASLTHAIRHSLDVFAPVDAWLVALGDMPRVAPSTLQSLVDALQQGVPIVAPALAGKRGNPVGFGRAHLDALLALRGEEGARRLLKTFPVTEVAVDDAGIFLDVDTPADL